MVVKEVVEVKHSPEITFVKYGNINCFALFVVKNDVVNKMYKSHQKLLLCIIIPVRNKIGFAS